LAVYTQVANVWIFSLLATERMELKKRIILKEQIRPISDLELVSTFSWSDIVISGPEIIIFSLSWPFGPLCIMHRALFCV